MKNNESEKKKKIRQLENDIENMNDTKVQHNPLYNLLFSPFFPYRLNS